MKLPPEFGNPAYNCAAFLLTYPTLSARKLNSTEHARGCLFRQA